VIVHSSFIYTAIVAIIMKEFALEHWVNVPRHIYWDFLYTQAFDEVVFESLNLGNVRTLDTRYDPVDKVDTRACRVKPNVELPELVREVIADLSTSNSSRSGGGLVYYTDIHKPRRVASNKAGFPYRLTFTTYHPSHQDLFTIRGTITLGKPEDAKEAKKRCFQRIKVKVDVNIPILGGKIESFIEEEVTRTFNLIPDAIDAWYQKQQ
jgi:hypothetical protein